MKKFLALALALLGFTLSDGATRSRAEGCCVKTPKQCFPALRIPPEEYVYSPAVFSPPDGPVPYSVWYYTLYDQFCQGKSEEKCVWACAKKPAVKSGGEKRDGD